MAGTGVMAKKTGRRGHSVKYFKRRDIHGTLGGWNVDMKGRMTAFGPQAAESQTLIFAILKIHGNVV